LRFVGLTATHLCSLFTTTSLPHLPFLIALINVCISPNQFNILLFYSVKKPNALWTLLTCFCWYCILFYRENSLILFKLHSFLLNTVNKRRAWLLKLLQTIWDHYRFFMAWLFFYNLIFSSFLKKNPDFSSIFGDVSWFCLNYSFHFSKQVIMHYD